MEKKKILSIEDRIPKLKEQRKKKANRRLIFYLSIFFVLISIIVYLQSPLSDVKNITVTGNSLVTEKEVVKLSKLTTKTNIWTINQSKIENLINENPITKSVKVTRKLPRTIQIELTEYEHVGYIKEENELFPIIGNGTTLPSVQSSIGDAPLLEGFSDEKQLHSMTEELKELPISILNLISEIHWKPTKENKNKILLYMNDGYTVDGTIRDFAEKMEVYPSIISQLEPDSKGVIHIGVGAYFESYEKESEEKTDE